MQLLTCSRCRAEKPSSEFTPIHRGRRGYGSWCRRCNAEYQADYRRRKLAEDPNGYRAHCAATEARRYDRKRAAIIAAIERRRKENPQAFRAKKAVENAVARGTLRRPSRCSRCGRTGIPLDGHHPDYERKLDVIWLCRVCHKAEHMGVGCGAR